MCRTSWANDQGRPSPSETMMHFPPLFQISSLFPKNFRTLREISLFSSAKISDDLFFSHRPQISNFPHIFAVSVYFPPVSQKFLFPPALPNFPPPFYTNSPAFCILYVYFVSPPTFTMMHLCIIQCTYWTPLLMIEFSKVIKISSNHSHLVVVGQKNGVKKFC